MATPNSEQLSAINHAGGVLLQAGAGSGKTFVLKEHLIFLAKNLVEQAVNEGLGHAEFSILVRQRFKKIVLMTFTKKAAGELNIRLFSEFESLVQQAQDHKELWDVLFAQLTYLNVSTIHGFCFKLIGTGMFPGVSADQEILSDVEHKNLIETLCEDFLRSHLVNVAPHLQDLILKEKSKIFDSIHAIFCDPTLRYAWSRLEAKNLFVGLEDVFRSLFEEYCISPLFDSNIVFANHSDLKGKKWFDFCLQIESDMNRFDYTLSSVCKLISFFEQSSFKIPVRPRKGKIDESLIEYFEKVIALKDFLKANGEDIIAFEKEQVEKKIISPWLQFILDMFNEVDAEYGKVSGLTFSDMEYIVFKNLENPEVRKAFAKEFDYFIVDEFQDTSQIQFSILEHLVEGDFSKLFCVGDLKQAIYGFRGGELEVFRNCSRKIAKNLSLKNNYRSTLDIIKFNNQFFEHLFKLGAGFSGEDPHTVDVEYQSAPEHLTEPGCVEKIVIDAPAQEEKYSNLEINYLEALALRSKVSELTERGEGCAILYKKLKPSLILIHLLMEKNISFSAQVKIPLLEDPILGIFLILIEKDINISESKSEYQVFLLSSYLKLLGSEVDLGLLVKEVNTFEVECLSFGLYPSFRNFIYRLGLRLSHFTNNLSFIETIIESVGTQRSTLYKVITSQKTTSHSLAFEYGDNPELATIMSAHGSKGLQFPHVLMGGIYTNDRSANFTDMVGKLPFSLKWVDSIFGKKRFKTPHYLLEAILTKNKEFSENKRLFYVACTRAERGLYWCDINWGESKKATNPKASWHAGFQLWQEIKSTVVVAEKFVDISTEFDNHLVSHLDNNPPLFHKSPLGTVITPKEQKISFISELSVTKLAVITVCPRKFYFESICKISDEELDLFRVEKSSLFKPENLDELSSKNILKSSASRGTKIHEYLSEVVLSDFKYKNDDFDQFDWLVDKLTQFRDNFELISEKPIKFELFGHMLSGIPDLILRPVGNKDELQIWDYKTGKYSEDKLSAYYFQLMVYAYSQYKLGLIAPEKSCVLVILFVDEKKVVDYKVSLLDVENYLSLELEKINRVDEKNLDACEFCKFSNICDK